MNSPAGLLGKYGHWLHGQWPAGVADKLPLVNEDFTTNIPGVYVVGDLTGVPLLKFAADSGARVVDKIQSEKSFALRKSEPTTYDIIVVGAGVSGWSAALQAEKAGLSCLLLESTESFSTIKNFPAGKPIFTYPSSMQAKGELQLSERENTKEVLFASLNHTKSKSDIEPIAANVSHVKKNRNLIAVSTDQGVLYHAHRVVLAIGKSGNHRQLKVNGEDLPKVVNRLHDPANYLQGEVAVVGGGDSAIEAVIAIAGARDSITVTPKIPSQRQSLSLIHRRSEFSSAKQENVDALLALEAAGKVEVLRSTKVTSITDTTVTLQSPTSQETIRENDAILTLLGREAPLDFFRRSKIDIQGESSPVGWMALVFFVLLVTGVYDWKNFGFLNSIWSATAYPEQVPDLLSGLSEWWRLQVEDRSSLWGTIAISMKSRSFYFTIVYTCCIGYFGWRRINRRNTPYVTVQTWTLFLVQFIPLFLLPEVFLPWLGYNGFFDGGLAKSIVDSLFPSYISAAELAAQQWPEWGHPRAYWHAYGFILAWPLSVYNVFTPTPMVGWLVICFIQTFVLIPLLVYRFGKGAYCGWICSCGGLAETMGDTQRHKMPHGVRSNRWNYVGQILLAVAFLLLVLRIYGWVYPDSWAAENFDLLLKGENAEYQLVNAFSWKWTVDVLLGGVLGVGLYFKYSGRVWCRFACPLAALMNIYARFSRFRIFAEKAKCISCNQCTSVCHQGIDVMAFANKGKPMEDPQCVRCSACVQVCPTGVLQFGEIDATTGEPLRYDRLQANAVQVVEVSNA